MKQTYREATTGPATADGPSVDDFRALMKGEPTTWADRTDSRRPVDHAVIRGVPQGLAPEVSDEEAEALRKSVRPEGREARANETSYSEWRDPANGQVVRTYGDGRTEVVDESRPGKFVR